MAAEGWLAFLIVVLNLGNLAHLCDTQELRCQCIQISSDFIPLKFIKNIWVIPENIYCSQKEVIVLLKNGKLICLNPKAEWVMALIEKIMHRTLMKDHTRNHTPNPMMNNIPLHLLEFEHPFDLS